MSTQNEATRTGPGDTPVAPVSLRVAMGCAVATTVAIGVSSFVISFAALVDLAVRAGQPARLAWLWPVIVDGSIMYPTVALVALAGQKQRRRRGRGYFWAVLATGASVSIFGNALHATIAAGTSGLSPAVAAVIAAVAPVSLLAATHGIAILARPGTTAQVPTGSAPAAARDTTVAGDDAPAESGDTPGDSGAAAGGEQATPERDAQIRAWAAAGYSTRAIGREVGLHHSRVARIVAQGNTSNGTNATGRDNVTDGDSEGEAA